MELSGQAGLVCLDKRVYVGLCQPHTVRTVNIPFHAYSSGVYDLSHAIVLLENAPSTMATAKLVGSHVYVRGKRSQETNN